jgi:hypothetical protein
MSKMLNRDINSRFEDWLVSPAETLDFEAKRWLNMADVESQGVVAKALIALENHGGGFLLFGYMEDNNKRLVPDPARPSSLKPYLADSINGIVKSRAEPAFHVEVTIQAHPETGDEYPLVCVSGRSRVPVRSDSATPGGSLKHNHYYIRGPGPESKNPSTAAEWDTLLRRAVMNQREEIISVLRAFLPASATLTNDKDQTSGEMASLILSQKQSPQRSATDPEEQLRQFTNCLTCLGFVNSGMYRLRHAAGRRIRGDFGRPRCRW